MLQRNNKCVVQVLDVFCSFDMYNTVAAAEPKTVFFVNDRGRKLGSYFDQVFEESGCEAFQLVDSLEMALQLAKEIWVFEIDSAVFTRTEQGVQPKEVAEKGQRGVTWHDKFVNHYETRDRRALCLKQVIFVEQKTDFLEFLIRVAEKNVFTPFNFEIGKIASFVNKLKLEKPEDAGPHDCGEAEGKACLGPRQIPHFSEIPDFQSLESLCLKQKYLTDVPVLSDLKCLRELDLSHNLIFRFDSFKNLKDCALLEALNLECNPLLFLSSEHGIKFNT